ncbi:4697_t:CDS:2 [Funneliformis mosseae]|uniref:4697_t:CDS:1 n=1 Tax=Funneliformis mosseae TaxID=27381 RepID=A0A9N8V9Z8_FUNMO|nr:4697_t:CDS:2 [Funneliformis mosseae]
MIRYNNGNESDTEDYSTPVNDDILLPFTPLNTTTQTTSSRHEPSLNDLHRRHDSNTSPEGQQQYTTPSEDDIHHHSPLEKLQAEVAASHERIEGLRRELNEREKNKRIINRSWSWFVKIMAKHAIINFVILAIIFAAYALRSRRRHLPIKDSWLQRLRMRNRKVKQFAKSALTDFKSTH